MFPKGKRGSSGSVLSASASKYVPTMQLSSLQRGQEFQVDRLEDEYYKRLHDEMARETTSGDGGEESHELMRFQRQELDRKDQALKKLQDEVAENKQQLARVARSTAQDLTQQVEANLAVFKHQLLGLLGLYRSDDPAGREALAVFTSRVSWGSDAPKKHSTSGLAPRRERLDTLFHHCYEEISLHCTAAKSQYISVDGFLGPGYKELFETHAKGSLQLSKELDLTKRQLVATEDQLQQLQGAHRELQERMQKAREDYCSELLLKSHRIHDLDAKLVRVSDKHTKTMIPKMTEYGVTDVNEDAGDEDEEEEEEEDVDDGLEQRLTAEVDAVKRELALALYNNNELEAEYRHAREQIQKMQEELAKKWVIEKRGPEDEEEEELEEIAEAEEAAEGGGSSDGKVSRGSSRGSRASRVSSAGGRAQRQAEFDAMQSELLYVKELCDANEEQIESLEVERDELTATVGELTEKCATLEEENAELKTAEPQVVAPPPPTTESVAAQTALTLDGVEELYRAVVSGEKSGEEGAELRAVNLELREKIQSMQEEIEDFGMESAGLYQQIKVLEDERDATAAEVGAQQEAMEEETGVLIKKIETLEEEVEILQDKNHVLREKVEHLQMMGGDGDGDGVVGADVARSDTGSRPASRAASIVSRVSSRAGSPRNSATPDDSAAAEKDRDDKKRKVITKKIVSAAAVSARQRIEKELTTLREREAQLKKKVGELDASCDAQKVVICNLRMAVEDRRSNLRHLRAAQRDLIKDFREFKHLHSHCAVGSGEGDPDAGINARIRGCRGGVGASSEEILKSAVVDIVLREHAGGTCNMPLETLILEALGDGLLPPEYLVSFLSDDQVVQINEAAERKHMASLVAMYDRKLEELVAGLPIDAGTAGGDGDGGEYDGSLSPSGPPSTPPVRRLVSMSGGGGPSPTTAGVCLATASSLGSPLSAVTPSPGVRSVKSGAFDRAVPTPLSDTNALSGETAPVGGVVGTPGMASFGSRSGFGSLSAASAKAGGAGADEENSGRAMGSAGSLRQESSGGLQRSMTGIRREDTEEFPTPKKGAAQPTGDVVSPGSGGAGGGSPHRLPSNLTSSGSLRQNPSHVAALRSTISTRTTSADASPLRSALAAAMASSSSSTTDTAATAPQPQTPLDWDPAHPVGFSPGTPINVPLDLTPSSAFIEKLLVTPLEDVLRALPEFGFILQNARATTREAIARHWALGPRNVNPQLRTVIAACLKEIGGIRAKRQVSDTFQKNSKGKQVAKGRMAATAAALAAGARQRVQEKHTTPSAAAQQQTAREIREEPTPDLALTAKAVVAGGGDAAELPMMAGVASGTGVKAARKGHHLGSQAQPMSAETQERLREIIGSEYRGKRAAVDYLDLIELVALLRIDLDRLIAVEDEFDYFTESLKDCNAQEAVKLSHHIAAERRVLHEKFNVFRTMETYGVLALHKLNRRKENILRAREDSLSKVLEEVGHISLTHPKESKRLLSMAKLFGRALGDPADDIVAEPLLSMPVTDHHAATPLSNVIHTTGGMDASVHSGHAATALMTPPLGSVEKTSMMADGASPMVQVTTTTLKPQALSPLPHNPRAAVRAAAAEAQRSYVHQRSAAPEINSAMVCGNVKPSARPATAIGGGGARRKREMYV